LLCVCLVLLFATLAFAGDWPMWRYGPNRGGASPEQLAANLHLQWTRVLPALNPAWPREPRLQFDGVYQPVVMGKTLFLSSSLNDSLTAYDAETGAEKWRFYANGPVRFAPMAARGKVWFASDDGFLYCLNASDGALVWKFFGGPASRKLLGNERLISAWPARGGPVLADNTVYFAAGIWPFMGVFVHALDADTGKVLWTNDDSNSLYRMVDHNLYDYIGISPQGYMVVVNDKLIVPCGRSWPACFDRKTGKLLYFRQGHEMKDTVGKNLGGRTYRGGSYHVIANSRYIFNMLNYGGLHYRYIPRAGIWGGILRINDGGLVQIASRTNVTPELVLDDDAIYGAYGDLCAYSNTNLAEHEAVGVSGRGLVIQADGVSVPFKQAMFTSAGPKAVNYIHREFPTLLAIKRNYNQTLVKLDLSKIKEQPKEVMAAMKVSWALVAGQSATVTFHRMLSDWSQQACWTKPFPDKAGVWNGLRPNKDYVSRPFAVVKSPRVMSGDVYEINGFARALANWQSGKWKNYGFTIKIDGPAVQINMSLPKNARSKITKTTKLGLPVKWRLACKAQTLMKAGSRLYVGAKNELTAVDVPAGNEGARISWKTKVKGVPKALVAAAGRLYAVTPEGRLYCYGSKKTQPKEYPLVTGALAASDDSSEKTVADILKTTGVSKGYCIVLGAGKVVDELLKQSELYVIALDTDKEKIAALRKRLVNAGLYGKRAACFTGDVADAGLPPYLASIIVAEKFSPQLSAQKIFNSLRPYGGVLVAKLPESRGTEFAGWAAEDKLENSEVNRVGEYSLLTRVGALPGAGRWTHEYANEARSLTSSDAVAKPPFGVLWFGGQADGLFTRPFMTPRYYPSPQVVGGRLFAQAMESMSAIDVYTGRKLWETRLLHPSKAYNVYHVRSPGYPSATTPDSIYVGCGEVCLRLDPKTGRKISEFRLPAVGRNNESPYWAQVIVSGDLLIVGAVIPRRFWESGYKRVKKEDLTTDEILKMQKWIDSMIRVNRIQRRKGESRGKAIERNMDEILNSGNIPAHFPKKLRDAATRHMFVRLSRNDRIYVMNRITGKILWERKAVFGFTNIDNRSGNARLGTIAVGNGKIFILDSLHEGTYNMLKRRGKIVSQLPELLALDQKTGKVLWKAQKKAMGKSWVSYSAGKDVVLIGTAGNLGAFRGADGKELWAVNTPGNTFSRPSITRDDYVITMFLRGDLTGRSLATQSDSMHREWVMQDLLTGQVKRRFRATGAYCGFATSGPDYLAFRATSLAYYDFKTDSVRNLSGFRTACSNNLIPADGVISAPHLGWHCMCNYPIFTSLSLIHMPETDQWAHMPIQKKFIPPKLKKVK